MADDAMEMDEKIAHFQSLTGIEDPDLCAAALSANDWDLRLAVSSLNLLDYPRPTPPPTGLAWKIASLPFYALSAAAGLGAWAASRALGRLATASSSRPVLTTADSSAAAESFAASFAREYGDGVNFVEEGFEMALERSRIGFRPMFVYLHSPNHPDTPWFCSACLGPGVVADFVNENFVAWGGSIRGSEAFKIADLLRASRFPFCAVVMSSAADQGVVILKQIDGAKTPEEMLFILQQVLEDTSPALAGARREAEERIQLRDEQDAAYLAALDSDRAREISLQEEHERLEREATEAERRHREATEAEQRHQDEEEAQYNATIEAALARCAKAMSFGAEPDKGPDVTEVLVRFPTGERKCRRFPSSSTIKCLYDYVDSLDCLKAEKFKLVSNFPRVSYGPENYSSTLKEAGLHPQAILCVEPEA